MPVFSLNATNSHLHFLGVLPMSSVDHSQIYVGDIGHFRRFHRDCPPWYRAQLLSMGLVPNTPLTVERRAPLGDPLVIRVNQSLLTVRASELAFLHIDWSSHD